MNCNSILKVIRFFIRILLIPVMLIAILFAGVISTVFVKDCDEWKDTMRHFIKEMKEEIYGL